MCLACNAGVLLGSASYRYKLAIVYRAVMFDFSKSGVEISISPQPSSALRIQDSDHTFREEVLSTAGYSVGRKIQSRLKRKGTRTRFK